MLAIPEQSPGRQGDLASTWGHSSKVLAGEERGCFLCSEGSEEIYGQPQPSGPGQGAIWRRPGPQALAAAAVQLDAPLVALGVLWTWVAPVILVERLRCCPVLCRHPSGLPPLLASGAACHLHWSKLPSGVLAWSVARDASSLCHSP